MQASKKLKKKNRMGTSSYVQLYISDINGTLPWVIYL